MSAFCLACLQMPHVAAQVLLQAAARAMPSCVLQGTDAWKGAHCTSLSRWLAGWPKQQWSVQQARPRRARGAPLCSSLCLCLRLCVRSLVALHLQSAAQRRH